MTVNVLVTSAGATNAINVIKALKRQSEIDISITTVDIDPLSAGLYLSDKHYIVPPATSEDFLPRILDICKKEAIRIIIPVYSAELPIFAENKRLLEEHGVGIAISPLETIETCDDKIRIYQFFEQHNIPYPKLYTRKELNSEDINFPLFIKRRKSSGSKDAHVISNREELNFYLAQIEDPIVQDFAGGDEYTIDIICDLNGKMIEASPRRRIQTRGGLAVKAVTVRDKTLIAYARKIVEELGIIGPANIQCKVEKDNIRFIEVNPRLPSGGLPLAVAAGLNIPLIIVKMLLGMEIGNINVRGGVFMVRYWDALFVEEENGGYRLRELFYEFR